MNISPFECTYICFLVNGIVARPDAYNKIISMYLEEDLGIDTGEKLTKRLIKNLNLLREEISKLSNPNRDGLKLVADRLILKGGFAKFVGNSLWWSLKEYPVVIKRNQQRFKNVSRYQ